MTMTADAAQQDTPLTTTYRPAHPLDLHATVGVLRRGPHDPTMVVDGPVIWRSSRTPDGIATIALRSVSGEVRATAWGSGAARALEQLPRLCGADDDASGFDASRHPVIADSAHRNPGLRLTRTDIVFDALAASILEQKVTALQAFGAWRTLVSRFGDRAPGPTPRPMFVPPVPQGWRCIPSWSWHRAGVQPPQSKTIVHAAERGDSIARALDTAHTGPDRDRVLTSLPGIGPWTASETRARALGDPDAVSVGDYHLAHEVGYALTGERADDERMLELLAPWAGQRHRAIRLILSSGIREPRRGPRLAPEDHRRR